MNSIYTPFRSDDRPSGLLLVIFILLGAGAYFHLGKLDSFFLIHNSNSGLFDWFFKNYTHLGDGLFCLVIFLFLLTRKYRYALDFLFIFLMTGLLVQIGKRLLFPEELRPLGLLGAEALNIIEGVNLYERNSFPSGHTATGVATFFFLSLLVEGKNWKVLLVVLGTMVGYSRIYIGQHFFEDVLAGMVVGTLSVVLWVWVSQKIQWPQWTEKRKKIP